MTAPTAVIRTSESQFLGPDGEPLLLRGVCLGGWLNMENFITGYAANETLMRREVRKVIGDDRADRFFDRLLTQFFGQPDAAFLGQSGLNLARIAVGYKHFEDDARPFEIKSDGFRHLDRAIELLGRRGVYSIVDLHALPGSQNQHWHSDNPTHIAAFWEHRHFQDRVVHLWEAIADHYRGNPWVAGYNLLNEPSDESRSVVGPFYRRLVSAIGAVDPGMSSSSTATRTRPSSTSSPSRSTTPSTPCTTACRPASGGARTTAGRRRRRSSSSAPRTRARPAVPSWSGSSGRSTPATRRRTRSCESSSPTSWTSTRGTRPAGRCGCIRTSAAKVWSRCVRTLLTDAVSTTSWPRRTVSPRTSGAVTGSARRRSRSPSRT